MSTCTFPSCACDVPATCSRTTVSPTTQKATMTNETIATSIAFADLPALNSPLEGGTFAGITTRNDGTHAAVIFLPNKAQDLTWKQAIAWAKEQDGELPTRPVAALLFTNVKDKLEKEWHWTADEYSASYAWYCGFDDGDQDGYRKVSSLAAVAVRLIPLTA